MDSHPTWQHAPEHVRGAVARRLVLTSALAGAVLLPCGALSRRTGIVLDGSVRLSDASGHTAVVVGPGALFGWGASPAYVLDQWQAAMAQDGRVAWLTPREVMAVCKKVPALAYFFPSLTHRTSRPALPVGATSLLTRPLGSLVKRPPLTVAPDTSVIEAAQLMRKHRVSSVLVVENERLYGLVTDRDLRNRVVAPGLDVTVTVDRICSRSPLTAQANSPAFDAMLSMARHNVHHMPVMDADRIFGMVTATDLTDQQRTSAVHLVGEIYKQADLDGLVTVSAGVKRLQQHLAESDTNAYGTGHIVTAVTDAVTVRLLQLAEARLGPAPVDYVWVAAGSQARNEQTAKSDQDNCLVLDDEYDAAEHGPYFQALADWVCDGLNACGYIHCPGEMMAKTNQWRQPLRQWIDYFEHWIAQPKPKALMLTCVFFDLRAIHGSTTLLERLQASVVHNTRTNSLFLAYMVSNALKHRPPLGMFGQIQTRKDDAHHHTIDLKHSAIVPIVDLARIYALATGVSTANTHDRLVACANAAEISAESARDLRDALEFLFKLRIAHQSRQIALGKAPDNHLALEELSNLERTHLKSAFQVVQTLQDVLQQRYGGRF